MKHIAITLSAFVAGLVLLAGLLFITNGAASADPGTGANVPPIVLVDPSRVPICPRTTT
ncbi:MAG: hypothetical protein R3C44_07290 [Chloroflexota bacterium]